MTFFFRKIAENFLKNVWKLYRRHLQRNPKDASNFLKKFENFLKMSDVKKNPISKENSKILKKSRNFLKKSKTQIYPNPNEKLP